MKTKYIFLWMLGLSLITSAYSRAGDFDAMIVFGDSLSDPGNYYQLFGEQEVMPFEPDNVPGAPYPMGGHHFSNGETWIEQLTRSLKIPQSGSPASVAPGIFTNYAVGRSRARNTLLNTVFSEENLTTQVDRFLDDDVSAIPAGTLYVVWIGSNDVADALGAYLVGNVAAGEAIITAAVSNTAAQLIRLYQAGARHLLIPNIPDLALTPGIRNLALLYCQPSPAPAICQQQIMAQVSMISGGYNGAIQLALLGLSQQLPDVSIRVLDVSAFLGGVAADPAAYGFKNAQESCVQPDTLRKVFCGKASDYLFWDGQHPTKSGHRVLAEYALQQMAAK
jgi:phospholipase/lecithinase/hemolysin